jgi:hypothetical protein
LDGEYLFDTDLTWIGFIHDGNMWTADQEGIWLGPAGEGVLMDRKGRVALWTRGVHVSGKSAVYQPARPYRPPRPQRPPRPNRPPRPERPPRPSGGWSPLSFGEWLTGGILRSTDETDDASEAPAAGPRWIDFGN